MIKRAAILIFTMCFTLVTYSKMHTKVDEKILQSFQLNPNQQTLTEVVKNGGLDESHYLEAYAALLPLFEAIRFGEVLNPAVLQTDQLLKKHKFASQILSWLLLSPQANVQTNSLLAAGFLGWNDFRAIFLIRIQEGQIWQKLAAIDATKDSKASWATKVLKQGKKDTMMEVKIACEQALEAKNR